MTSVLIKRGDLDTQAGPERRRYEETQGEYGHPQAKECLRLPEAGREAWVRSFHGDFRGTMALLIPWFQTSGLPKRETINYWCSWPASLWYFVTAALGSSYTYPRVSWGGIFSQPRDLSSNRFIRELQVCSRCQQRLEKDKQILELGAPRWESQLCQFITVPLWASNPTSVSPTCQMGIVINGVWQKGLLWLFHKRTFVWQWAQCSVNGGYSFPFCGMCCAQGEGIVSFRTWWIG